eukprot:1447675-Alexandrium_andersonii.AAC.1
MACLTRDRVQDPPGSVDAHGPLPIALAKENLGRILPDQAKAILQELLHADVDVRGGLAQVTMNHAEAFFAVTNLLEEAFLPAQGDGYANIEGQQRMADQKRVPESLC